jgi:OmcA/MtrC family decaheme c-type cytochrome
MASYNNCSGRIAALMLVGLLFAGCDGGKGPVGPSGSDGAAGPPGPAGPSTGSGVPVTSADKIIAVVTGVSISASEVATVSLQLTNDLGQGLRGLPAANIRFVIAQLTPGEGGGSSAWQSYVTRNDGGVPNIQATTETATAGTYVDNNDGTYTYTFANALDDYPAGPVFDASKTHRVGIEIRTTSGGFWPENIPADNAPFDFLPTGGAPTFERLIVDSAQCNACHDNLEFHGEARFDPEYCVQCHNPSSFDGNTGNTVDMKVLIHNIHAARPDYVIVGFGGIVHQWADVEYPQDLRNCQTCHDEDDPNTPQASNYWKVPNRAACGTCHYDDGDPANGVHDYDIQDGVHPLGILFPDDTQCLTCHGPEATITDPEGRLVRVLVAHEILEKTAGLAFKYNILDISGTEPGGTPVVRFSVTDPTNGDAPYNIKTDSPFIQCAGGASRLAIDVGWSTTDFTNSGSGSLPALPITMNPLICGGASVENPDLSFTVTAGSQIPLNAVGSVLVAIEGHPAVDVDNNGSFERIAVTNAVDFAIITGANIVPRRVVVDVQKCDDCHNQLSVHGNNRTDRPEVCDICHNPNMTDIGQRGPVASPTDPPTDCLNVLGADDTPIDFKVMIHAIHASGHNKNPYEVCGFRNSVHIFEVEYPGRLNNCEGCHFADTYFPVDTTKVLGTTINVNDPSTPTDDLVISPNSAVCSSCHIEQVDIEHMQQNGGDFNATKAADSALISSGVETCEVCHGPGRTADVKIMHGVGSFEFN